STGTRAGMASRPRRSWRACRRHVNSRLGATPCRRDRTNSLTSLQGLFDQTNLLVVTPAPSTLDAQHLHLHSLYDLKARLEVTSSESRPNYTRRPSPERYGVSGADCGRRARPGGAWRGALAGP